MEQPKVNQLLGPALKSLYDIEVYLRKSTLEAELRELVKLRVSQIIDVLIASSIIAEMLSSLGSLNERFICLTPGKRRPNFQTERAPRWLGRKRSR
jgi:hypothetical protein